MVSLLLPSQRLTSVGFELFVTPFKVDLRFTDSAERLKDGWERMLGLVLRRPILPRVLPFPLMTTDRLCVVMRFLLELADGVLAPDDGRVIVAALQNHAHSRVRRFAHKKLRPARLLMERSAFSPTSWAIMMLLYD